MAFLETNPRYRKLLERHGLVSVQDFLALEGVIVCGHPDRHVVRVQVGTGSSAHPAFLKREHRVRWKDRLLNAWAGFGFVSKSYRESLTLRMATATRIGCPEWLAVGEDDQGHAFLLVREIAEATDLRRFLQGRQTVPERARRRFAQRLGTELARLHNAGFDHPDLYSKHVLVDPRDRSIRFLDWQRTRRQHVVSWPERWRDLAALDATLAESLAPVSERVVCLRTYLRVCRAQKVPGNAVLLRSAFGISHRASGLLRQRRIREIRQVPLLLAPQKLLWLDGEKLCMTPECRRALGELVPGCLKLANLPTRPQTFLTCSTVAFSQQRPSRLVRRRVRSLGRAVQALLRGRPTSPELRQAGLLFRLERLGVQAPRLLAFGQQWRWPWYGESFLLTEPIADTVNLTQWLSEHSGNEEARLRRHMLRESADLVRRLHDANCYNTSGRSDDPSFETLGVAVTDKKITAVLCSVDGIATCHQSSARRARRDLLSWLRTLAFAGMGRSDQLRFLLSYLRLQRLTPQSKRLARSVLALPGRPLLGRQALRTNKRPLADRSMLP